MPTIIEVEKEELKLQMIENLEDANMIETVIILKSAMAEYAQLLTLIVITVSPMRNVFMGSACTMTIQVADQTEIARIIKPAIEEFAFEKLLLSLVTLPVDLINIAIILVSVCQQTIQINVLVTVSVWALKDASTIGASL